MKTIDHIDSPSSPPHPAKANALAAEPLLPNPEETSCEAALHTSPRLSSPAKTGTPPSGDRYVRLHLHDQGGMGRVWAARDTCLDRDVALKELHPEMAENPSVLARFLREAKITGQLEHPGVVPVYELARPDDERCPFYTMRFVRGRTMTQASQDYHRKVTAGAEASLDLSALLHAFVTVCNTIGYAHSRGVIHRDLKGQNVILGDFGEVLVLDWGLAKLLDRQDGVEEALAEEAGNDSDDVGLTLHGQALGTPASMAPEQAAGRLDQIDHRTDIYGLGAILYEILTGHPPFEGTSTRAVLNRVLNEEPTPPRQLCPEVPLGLETVCLRALAKKPNDRYAAAKELAETVQQWQEAERRQAEKELLAREQRFRSLVEATAAVVWDTPASGEFETEQPRWSAFTGQDFSQLRGWGWLDAVHPDDRPNTVHVWSAAVNSRSIYQVEHRLRRHDGEYRQMLVRAVPILAEDGSIREWVGIHTDIDDRKRSEEELRLAKEAAAAANRAIQDHPA